MLYSSQHSHDIHVAKCHKSLMVHNICCCFFKYQKTVHKSGKCLKFSKMLSPWHYKIKVLFLELSDSSWHVRKIINRKPWYAARRISLAVAYKEEHIVCIPIFNLKSDWEWLYLVIWLCITPGFCEINTTNNGKFLLFFI